MKIHALCAAITKTNKHQESWFSYYCSVIGHKTTSLLDLFYSGFKLGVHVFMLNRLDYSSDFTDSI